MTPTLKEQTRLALGSTIIPIFFAIGFALCIVGVYHQPHPHDIKLGVVGPAARTAELRSGIATAAGPAFEISQVTTEAGAMRAVRARELDAAFVPTRKRRRPATVIVAGAGGRIVATAAEAVARSVTTAQRTQLVVRDVRPLPTADELGLGILMFMIVCTICGYFSATLLFSVAPDLPSSRRYPIMVAVAVLIPLLVYLIGGLGYGAYTGSFGTILAFIGVGALYMFVIGLITRLLQVLIGPAALFVSLALFIFINLASAGATYTAPVLAPFWHFINRFWIGAETVNAERSILYSGGDGVGTDLLRFLGWTAVVVALLLIPLSWLRPRKHESRKATGAWRVSTTTL